MQQRINDYFADKEAQLVEAISRMVRIDSTLGEAQPGKPFGPGPAAALEEMLTLSGDDGELVVKTDLPLSFFGDTDNLEIIDDFEGNISRAQKCGIKGKNGKG